ncbi:MAG: MopE-related protein [Bacteroidota bacterium]|nr:MopE-related protein [Bacteroidota bacterium]
MAQVPGQSYFDSTNYVEYIYGNSPIIISIPHGGLLEPINIPDRSCNGCVYGNDTHTQEIGRAIAQYYFEQTGNYPFVIINLLARVKLDANRPIDEAADGNPTAEDAWTNYHDFISSAKTKIEQDFGRGLFLDLHGHSHNVERVELGYTLTGTELRLSDETLNSDTYINKNSIKTLVQDNKTFYTHAEMLRGPVSMGALLNEKGFPTVPSPNDPAPKVNENYFNGGYNVWEHGSRLNSGNIDGIQIEINQDVRFDIQSRALFAEGLAASLQTYLGVHYGFGVVDFDGDGVMSDLDCDDTNPDIHPNAEEIPYNGIDDDCDPATLDDYLDQDGFNTINDCDDTNPNIHPNGEEIPYNGIDDDCDAATLDDDLDQDGFGNIDDCDDSNPNIHPNAEEIPYNGIDDDCDPATLDDDLDQDGFNTIDDCDDTNPNIHPNAEEILDNQIDENCDGLNEVSQSSASESEPEPEPEPEQKNNKLVIYPNPASEYIYILKPDNHDFKIEIFDVKQRKVFSVRNQSDLNIAHLSSGIYYLLYSDLVTGKRTVKKWIISK